MQAVDTNILIRYILADDAVQSPLALHLVQAGGLYVSRSVLLEFAWVLRSVYSFSHDRVAVALDALLRLPGLAVEQESQVRRALLAQEAGMEIADALHWAAAEQCDAFLSFDVKLVARAKRAGLKPPGVTPI